MDVGVWVRVMVMVSLLNVRSRTHGLTFVRREIECECVGEGCGGSGSVASRRISSCFMSLSSFEWTAGRGVGDRMVHDGPPGEH